MVRTIVLVPAAGAIQSLQVLCRTGNPEAESGSPDSAPAAKVDAVAETGTPSKLMRSAKLSLAGLPTVIGTVEAALAPASLTSFAVRI